MKKTLSRKKAIGLIVTFAALCLALIMGAGTAALSYTASAGAADYNGPVFQTEFDSVQEVVMAEHALNKEIAGEGYVLLKNNNTLPIKTPVSDPAVAAKPKISVFGKNSVNPVMSGTGSSGGSQGTDPVDIIGGLKNAGFEVNPELVKFYKDNELSGDGRSVNSGFTDHPWSYWNTGETPLKSYTDDVKDSYADYADAAVVVLSRTGGEGADLPRMSFAPTEGAVTSDKTSSPTKENIDAELAGTSDWTPVGGHGRESNPFEHYLELDDNEKDLIAKVKADFDKVVVILNATNVMEIGELADDEKIDSIVFAPGSGINGFDSLGKIIAGAINPSGKTVDTFARDFTKSPVWQNHASNRIGNGSDVTSQTGAQYYDMSGNPFAGDETGYGYFGVDYEEGIYVGYKYYETTAAEDFIDYEGEVVYPFGYGLSYTSFEWTLGTLSETAFTKDATFTLPVTVTNTGEVAGKDVVQLYYEAPYTDGGIEKSKVSLGDFVKTDLLAPGESQTVNLTVSAFDMASFDVYDKNDNGKKLIELDPGTYTLYVGSDSHVWADNAALKADFTLSDTIVWDKDPESGADIKPWFEEMNAEMDGRVMSRNDFAGTFPQSPYWFDVTEGMIEPLWLAQYRYIYGKNYAAADWKDGKTVTPVKEKPADFDPTAPNTLRAEKAQLLKTDEWLDKLRMPIESLTNPVIDPEWDATAGADKWYYVAPGTAAADVPEGAKVGTYNFRDADKAYADDKLKGASADSAAFAPIQLSDLAGKAIDDPAWDAFTSQLTVDQAHAAVLCMFGQLRDVDCKAALGIPTNRHSDGPQGITRPWVGDASASMNDWNGVASFCPETLLGCTWNVELAERQGDLVGEYGMWIHVGGWYAPGANMHRSPFGGRNFEYYSEDALHTGKMLTAVTVAASEKGLICFVKHMVCNDQETYRECNNVSVWVDEQAFREVYVKGFEMAVKAVNNITTTGDAVAPIGMMSSFNALGFHWAGASWEFMNGLLRTEFGMVGEVVTDAHGTGCGRMCSAMMIRAGGDMSLDGKANDTTAITQIVNSEEANTPTQLQALYDALKRQLYCLLNSSAMMNGYAVDFVANFTDDDDTNNVYYVDSNYKTGTYYANGVSPFTKINYKPIAFVEPGDTGVAISVAGAKVKGEAYSIYLGELPKGLTLNASTGVVEGDVAADAEPGSYNFSVARRASAAPGDEWTLLKHINYFSINVGGFDYTGDQTVTVKPGEAFSADVSFYAPGVNEVTVTFDAAASTVPNTVKFAGGKLYGTIAAEGQYEFTVKASAAGYNDLTQKIVIFVTDTPFDAPYIGENGNWFVNGKDTGVAATGPAGAQGEAGTPGAQGEKGDKGDKGDAGEAAKSGCGSLAGGTIVIVCVALALACIALVLLRKKNGGK